MKIIYIVSCINSKSNGMGGHYHSLLETASQISKKHSTKIITIGNIEPKALNNCNIETHTIINNALTIINGYNSLNKIILNEKPDVIHAFDSIAYFWARLLGKKYRIRYCVTLCGGVNPRYFPFSENIILFSKENLEYFKKHPKFVKSNLHLIPNRIRNFNDDIVSINKLKMIAASKIDNIEDKIVLLRISRIGKAYHKSTLQLINLAKRLNKDNIKCYCILIGTIEDQTYLNELKEKGDKYLLTITDDEFTKNAKRLISLGDIVLGTGRSFMEAASKNKILLCPSLSGELPILINNSNFEEAFFYNFSERTNITNYTDDSNYELIKKTISDFKSPKYSTSFQRSIFNEHFNSENISIKLEYVYSKINSNLKMNYWDLFLNALFLFRKYFK